MKRDFLTLRDYSTEEISQIVSLGASVKAERGRGERRNTLEGKTIAMIFDKPSLRTKATFETGIFELGGNALNLSGTGKLGERESVADIARNLERWVHMIVVRTFGHSNLEELASIASVPVVNALTDSFHPCQSIAMGMLIDQKFPGKKINIAYIGDGNNVCVSHMIYAAKMGHNISISTPKGYFPPQEAVEYATQEAKKSGGSVTLTTDPVEAVKRADLVYTDVWASMGQESEAKERIKIFSPYQINEELFSKAPSAALFSHCLPAHRGEEVTDGVVDSPRSVVFDEAENRLHAHKAIMIYLMQQGG